MLGFLAGGERVMIIKKVTIVRGNGQDILIMDTDLPNGCWPYDDTATVDMRVGSGLWESYCRNNFPSVPFEVVITCVAGKPYVLEQNFKGEVKR
jgi:hypothetical protein